jgi:hypothetical protein
LSDLKNHHGSGSSIAGGFCCVNTGRTERENTRNRAQDWGLHRGSEGGPWCSSCTALSSAVTSTRQRAGISPLKKKAHCRAASSVDSPACAPSTGMDTFGQLIIFSISRSKQCSRPRSRAAWSTLVGRARL